MNGSTPRIIPDRVQRDPGRAGTIRSLRHIRPGLPMDCRHAALCLGFVATAALADAMTYPTTPKIAVNATHHGTGVVDPYRWLEDDRAAEVKEWIAAQNALTRRHLDALPERDAIAKRVAELLKTEPVQRYGFDYRKQLFAFKRAPPKNQPAL